MKILIVEDDAQTAMQYQLALEDKNHNVVVTKNGNEACDSYSKALEQVELKTPVISPFDIIILDYRLPVKNGIQVAKKIMAKNPKQKVIFATGHMKEILTREAKEDIPVQVIEKPFELDEFVNKVENLAVVQ